MSLGDTFLMLFFCQHRGPEKSAGYHSKIDADIDSLTSMLADLDSHPQDSSTQVIILLRWIEI